MSPYICLKSVTEWIWLLPGKHYSHSYYAKRTHRSNILYISTQIQPTVTDTSDILPNMYQKQIYPSNAIYGNYFMCRYQTPMSVYIPHMNSMQSTMSPQALVYLPFKLLAYVPEKYSFHITHACSAALIMYSTYRFHITTQRCETNKQIQL